MREFISDAEGAVAWPDENDTLRVGIELGFFVALGDILMDMVSVVPGEASAAESGSGGEVTEFLFTREAFVDLLADGGGTDGARSFGHGRRIPEKQITQNVSVWQQAVHIELGLSSQVDFPVCHCRHSELYTQSCSLRAVARTRIQEILQIRSVIGTQNGWDGWSSGRRSHVNHPYDPVCRSLCGCGGCCAVGAVNLI